MNTWIEPPPPQRKGMGCFGRGCLILLVFALVLILACCAGLYWGYRNHSALVRGAYFLAKTHAITDSPRPLPQYNAPEQEIQAVKGRWQDFEHAVQERQPAEIELTADEINGLIEANRHARGKAFVSIEGNRLSLQTSVPLGKFLGQSGYYLSGDITIQSDAAASLAKPRLESVALNSQPVPHDLLDWKYHSRSLRDYLAEYSPIQDLGTIQIRDGKVILRSRAE
ncbi:MAG TPA: hypothetical protein VNY07_06715 [Chthoniobacterales bacterium]|nr:hypothetical protein [Chthoniobacterales bacterium]